MAKQGTVNLGMLVKPQNIKDKKNTTKATSEKNINYQQKNDTVQPARDFSTGSYRSQETVET